MGLHTLNINTIEDQKDDDQKTINVLSLIYMTIVNAVTTHQDTMRTQAEGLKSNSQAQQKMTERLGHQNLNLLNIHEDPYKKENFGHRLGHSLKGLLLHGNAKYYRSKHFDTEGDLNEQMMKNGRVQHIRSAVECKLSTLQQTDNIESSRIDAQTKGATQMIQEASRVATESQSLTERATLSRRPQ